MHKFETRIQEIKTAVLTEVARLTWEDQLQNGILDIPEKSFPDRQQTFAAASIRNEPLSAAA